MNNRLPALFLCFLAVLPFLPSSCNFNADNRSVPPTWLPSEPPVVQQPVQSTGEARIRYILADIQLGGIVGYYRAHTNEAEVAEAVRRWDAGIRVENESNFERKEVADQGWQIVYTGTQQTIDGMDVVLTEAQIVQEPAQQDQKTQVEPGGLCQNKYWPIVEGASWDYEVTDYRGADGGTIYKEHWAVYNVTPYNDGRIGGNFQARIECDNLEYCDSGGEPVEYYCDDTGIYYSQGKLVLPPENQIVLGASWPLGEGYALVFGGSSPVTVPAGTFKAVSFGFSPAMGSQVDNYGEGVGLIYRGTEIGKKELITYNIPGYPAPNNVLTYPTQAEPVASIAPEITAVNLRYETSSEGVIVWQDISFVDLDGDSQYITYQVVQSTMINLETRNGSIDISAEQQMAGSMITGKWICGNEKYTVTLQAVIVDRAGNTSRPYEYTMDCQ